jgi:hypothetical protein
MGHPVELDPGAPAAPVFCYDFYHRGHKGFFTEGTELLLRKVFGAAFPLRGTKAPAAHIAQQYLCAP